MKVDIIGVTLSINQTLLTIHSKRPLSVLSSAVFGGGINRSHWMLVFHVDKDYNNPRPAEDMRFLANSHGIYQPFIGLMTAAYLENAQAITLDQEGFRVAVVMTAGLSNVVSAGQSLPFSLSRPSTINTIVIIEGNLTMPGMVNAVVTATEAKSSILYESAIKTEQGYSATGTSTDAVVIACTGKGAPIDYAGPITPIGWLIARAIRQVFTEILQ